METSPSETSVRSIIPSTVDEWHTPLMTDEQIQDLAELEIIRKASTLAKLPSWKTPRRQRCYRLLQTKWMFNKHAKID
jgi:hypothetical protein